MTAATVLPGPAIPAPQPPDPWTPGAQTPDPRTSAPRTADILMSQASMSDAPPSDAALAALASEDGRAFELLYERYSAQVYRMVYSRLKDREAAQDVTSEVFLKALRAIHCYRASRAPFWAWLHKIAANAVSDHVRARRGTLPLDVVPDRQDPAADVEGAVLVRLEALRAWHVIGQLCDAQRTAVTLRLGADLPIADIADRMDRTEGAVKLLLNRGLTTVRIRMATGAAPWPAAS